MDKHTDSIPDSLLNVINVDTSILPVADVTERRKRYGQHDYYGNNVGGRNSISGMPGVWEENVSDQEYYMYLNNLRDSGVVNMFGAGPYLEREFGLDKREARKILSNWMSDFKDEQPDAHDFYMKEELMGSGLEIRQLADSFTLDELEQLYRDKKINNTDYNGAVNYLQAWINQHPTYLPQRDLTEPKRQKIRNKYLNENKMKKINEKTFAGKGAVTSFKNPATNPDFSKMDADTQKGSIETLMKGGSITTEQPLNEVEPISTLAALAGVFAAGGIVLEPGAMEDVWDFISQRDKSKKPSIDHGDSEKMVDPDLGYAQSHGMTNTMENMMESYLKESGDDNLMEHMDKYRKRNVLMESAMKRLFAMFDDNMTDEEIVQDHAQKGVQVPETFISKARKNWETLKKTELELEMGENEFKNSATPMVNNPIGSETGMEPGMEEKQLASGLK